MDLKFAIALHILAYISEAADVVTSELLAKSVGTNASYIRKIIALLKDKDMIEISQGKKGITLMADAGDITLDRVYFAVYPQKELLHVHDTVNLDCPVGASIKQALLPIFEESERQLVLSLQRRTLKDLIGDMYQIYQNENERRRKG